MSGKLAEIRQVANVRSVFSQDFDQSDVTAEQYYISSRPVDLHGKYQENNIMKPVTNYTLQGFFLRHTQSAGKWIRTVYGTQTTTLILNTIVVFPTHVWLARCRGGRKHALIDTNIHTKIRAKYTCMCACRIEALAFLFHYYCFMITVHLIDMGIIFWKQFRL